MNYETSVAREQFRDGSNLFGYDTFVRRVTIVAMEPGEGWTKPTLELGMKVRLLGDTKGYVPGNFQHHEQGVIVGFREPFDGEVSDHIVEVANQRNRGWVKPSNLEVP